MFAAASISRQSLRSLSNRLPDNLRVGPIGPVVRCLATRGRSTGRRPPRKNETQAKRGQGSTDEEAWRKIQEIESGLLKEYQQHGIQPRLKADAAQVTAAELEAAKSRAQSMGLGRGDSAAGNLLRKHAAHSSVPASASALPVVSKIATSVPHDGRGTFGDLSADEEQSLLDTGLRDVPPELLAKLLGGTSAVSMSEDGSSSDSELDVDVLRQLLRSEPGAAAATSSENTPPRSRDSGTNSKFANMLRSVAVEMQTAASAGGQGPLQPPAEAAIAKPAAAAPPASKQEGGTQLPFTGGGGLVAPSYASGGSRVTAPGVPQDATEAILGAGSWVDVLQAVPTAAGTAPTTAAVSRRAAPSLDTLALALHRLSAFEDPSGASRRAESGVRNLIGHAYYALGAEASSTADPRMVSAIAHSVGRLYQTRPPLRQAHVADLLAALTLRYLPEMPPASCAAAVWGLAQLRGLPPRAWQRVLHLLEGVRSDMPPAPLLLLLQGLVAARQRSSPALEAALVSSIIQHAPALAPHQLVTCLDASAKLGVRNGPWLDALVAAATPAVKQLSADDATSVLASVARVRRPADLLLARVLEHAAGGGERGGLETQMAPDAMVQLAWAVTSLRNSHELAPVAVQAAVDCCLHRPWLLSPTALQQAAYVLVTAPGQHSTAVPPLLQHALTELQDLHPNTVIMLTWCAALHDVYDASWLAPAMQQISRHCARWRRHSTSREAAQAESPLTNAAVGQADTAAAAKQTLGPSSAAFMGVAPAAWHQLHSVLLWGEHLHEGGVSPAVLSLLTPEMRFAMEESVHASSTVLTRSRFHESVLRCLSEMGVACSSEHPIGLGLSVDVWVPSATGASVALEVLGPGHFHPEAGNGSVGTLDATLSSQRREQLLLLAASKSTTPTTVKSISFVEWRELDTKTQRQQRLRQLLSTS